MNRRSDRPVVSGRTIVDDLSMDGSRVGLESEPLSRELSGRLQQRHLAGGPYEEFPCLGERDEAERWVWSGRMTIDMRSVVGIEDGKGGSVWLWFAGNPNALRVGGEYGVVVKRWKLARGA